MIQDTPTFKITKNENSTLNLVDWENLPFGRVFSDHMLVMEYADGQWKSPEIIPFGNVMMHPATSAIHYGQSIFEGMKANRTIDGELVIFRPDMNAKRFIESCERMCMPVIPEEMFIELVRKMVEIDGDWVPKEEGFSLYLRPFMFATDEFIGIRPSETYKFMIFTCPVGAYYSKPVNVKVEEYYTRAALGGVGRAKTAGNYGGSLYPAKLGQAHGFDQLLWTDAKEHKYIEESGTMNICFVIDNVLITPSEDQDTILRGVVKRSVVDLANKWGMKVEERRVSVEEIVEAARKGNLQDAFGAGTAATIAQVAKLGFRDEIFELPSLESRTFSNKAKAYLEDLKAGKVADDMGWLLKV